jgi:hypothetical protein
LEIAVDREPRNVQPLSHYLNPSLDQERASVLEIGHESEPLIFRQPHWWLTVSIYGLADEIVQDVSDRVAEAFDGQVTLRGQTLGGRLVDPVQQPPQQTVG